MREHRRGPVGDHARHGRQRERHLVQHDDVRRQDVLEPVGLDVVDDAQPALRHARVQRQEVARAEDALFRHDGQFRVVRRLLLRPGVRLERDGREERGVQVGLHAGEQLRPDRVALPEFVQPLPRLRMPAQRAQHEAAVGRGVELAHRRMVEVGHQVLAAQEILVQGIALRVDEVHAIGPRAASGLDDEQHVLDRVRRARLVDARE